MNRKPNFGESLKKFVEGKSFYVAVLVCVAAIGISGFYLLNSVTAPPENETVTPSPAVTPSATPSPSAAQPASPKPSHSATPKPSSSLPPSVTPPSAAVPSPSLSVPSSPSPAPSSVPTRPTALVYTWPVKGFILADFSLETLAYDDLMGTTVVIDHGNGIFSTYANLQTVPTVAEGDVVHTGAVIGAVGSTAIAESGRPSHLHFELYEDGIAVDPELYLPEEN